MFLALSQIECVLVGTCSINLTVYDSVDVWYYKYDGQVPRRLDPAILKYDSSWSYTKYILLTFVCFPSFVFYSSHTMFLYNANTILNI